MKSMLDLCFYFQEKGKQTTRKGKGSLYKIAAFFEKISEQLAIYFMEEQFVQRENRLFTSSHTRKVFFTTFDCFENLYVGQALSVPGTK